MIKRQYSIANPGSIVHIAVDVESADVESDWLMCYSLVVMFVNCLGGYEGYWLCVEVKADLSILIH